MKRGLTLIIGIITIAHISMGNTRNPGNSTRFENDCLVRGAVNILIIQDELEQMEVLSSFLKERQESIRIDIVDQDHLTGKLSNYDVVILYLHFKLFETTESKVIDFTEKGGRLIVLHHSISSGKAKNASFFPFLGVHLDGTDKANDSELPEEGYAWIEGVTFTLINLNSEHFVTSNHIKWGDEVYYIPSSPGLHAKAYPTISLPDSEVYLNHKYTDDDDKTILMGLKFYDIRNDQLFMQDRASWYKKAEKGDIFYFMPGHSSLEFKNSNFSQMIMNAINYSE